MPDIGKAYVQIVPTAQGIQAAVQDELQPIENSGTSIGDGLGSKLKKALVSAGIGTAVVKGLKAALDEGGALQQSFGGLDTLYGEASAQAKEFAMQAAEAGISANSYAEQAVSFGAALKSAFGGDTVKAAQAANTAIMDMADNSAKMGTDITAIQTAYQGFAKQNYTMLDNLKLGYGGTKEEMQRLLDTAAAMPDAMGKTFDINNLGDVYEAIHLIQQDLGLTGVAAEEAKTTFTGSFGAMKAAAQNVLAMLSTGGDLTQPLSQLMSSAGTFLIGNLVPMLTNVVTAIPGALMTLLTTVGPQIGTAISTAFTNLPGLLETGTSMVNELITGILTGLPGFIASGISMLGQFVLGILTNLPNVLAAGVSVVQNLVSGIAQNLPSIITSAYTSVIGFIAEVGAHLPEILEQGITLLGELAAGIIQAIPDLVAKLPEVFDGIKAKFDEFDWLQIGGDIISGIANGIKNAASTLWNAAKDAAGGLLNSFTGLFKIGSPSKLMADEVGQWIPAGIAEGIRANMGVLDSAVSSISAPIYANARYQPGEAYSVGEDIATALNSFGSEQDRNVSVNVMLQGDANRLFKVVRQENFKFAKQTGGSGL